MINRKRLEGIFILSLFCFCSVFAQKQELNHTVYDSWKRITQTQLTPNGKILSYRIQPQEGDGRLIIRILATQEEISINRGYDQQISPDGKWAYCLIKPLFAETRQAKIAKKSKEDMPLDSLACINLTTKQVTKYARVLSYKTGKDNKEVVAFLSAPQKEAKVGTQKSDDKKKKDNNNKIKTLLILRPANGQIDSIKCADQYLFNDKCSLLAISVKPDKKDSVNKSAILLYDIKSASAKNLSSEKKYYSAPVFNKAGDEIAFTASTDTTGTGNKHCSLFVYKKGVTTEIIPQDYKPNLPQGWSINENSELKFSKNGNRLFVGIAPWVAPKDTSIVDFETARVDIWHYGDLLTQTQQKNAIERLKKKTYLAVINLDKPNEIVPLTTSMFDKIMLLDKGDIPYAISADDTNYMISSQWDSNNKKDIAIVNLKDGSRKELFKGLNAEIITSPEGKYLLWYNMDDLQWYCYNISKGSTVCLTKSCNVKFYDEENDRPGVADPYTTNPVWMEKDEAVLISDRYDIWKFQPDGKYRINLSQGKGRKMQYQLRYAHLNTESDDNDFPSKESIKKGETIYLTAFDENTKENGMATIKSEEAQIPVVFVDTFTYVGMVKAKEASVIAYNKGNFAQAYNIYFTNNNWKTEKCLSDINPQMKNYRWGTAHLVSWKAYDGTPLKGLLYVPDNIDKSKKYPLMIYFYEKHSETLYNYIQPLPSRSTINISFYCSRGYVVFVPDVVYKVGHPGESAYNCIVSGAESMCQQYPYIDKANMAIQGQSWGGYQTAYLVTRTNMFKAAEAGAPVSNMTSAYGGIRWESGITRAGQYEHGQSRIGKTMWDKDGLNLYIENSPLFHADKINTPLLIMHNDADGAVPWYQGIEYYSALRRLGKKVWMLEYNDEEHNLKESRNTKDLSIRLQQFFDYYLKGAPMPVWMKSGIPATEKGTKFGFEEAK